MAQAVCTEDPAAEMAWRAHAERTLNMAAMVVTLEMSKLSGWLNADASCRVNGEHVKRPGCKARRAPETGGCGATCGVK